MIGPTKTSGFVFVLCNTHRRRPRSKPCLSDDDLLRTEVQPRFSSVVTILVHLRIRHNRLPRRKFFKSLFTVEHALVPARSRGPDSPAQPEAIDGPFEWKTRGALGVCHVTIGYRTIVSFLGDQNSISH
jgi:hypothetical protein